MLSYLQSRMDYIEYPVQMNVGISQKYHKFSLHLLDRNCVQPLWTLFQILFQD